MAQETPLSGGRTTTGVVRVGETVRRPIKPQAAFAHELLRHLEHRGFAGAPRFLGIDPSGREILSFIPGTVPAELGYFSNQQLIAGARLLREFHDATMDCPLRNDHEVVCHGDASPCNCVFVDGVPFAFIDFDDAHPGPRLDDLGYAAWLWTDIGNDELSVDVQARRVAAFFAAYGADTNDAVAAIIAAQISLAERARSEEVREWARSCHAWVESNRATFEASLEAGSSPTE